jgi:hypothetical protein
MCGPFSPRPSASNRSGRRREIINDGRRIVASQAGYDSFDLASQTLL